MPKIEIAHDVYAALQRRAVPFEDDINDVLRRLLRGDRSTFNAGVAPSVATSPPRLALTTVPMPVPTTHGGEIPSEVVADPGDPGDVVVRHRAATGQHLPQSTVRAAVLGIVRSTSGAVGVAELVRSVERQLHGRMTEHDLERLPSGLARWQNQVRNALTQLQHEGHVEQRRRRPLPGAQRAGDGRTEPARVVRPGARRGREIRRSGFERHRFGDTWNGAGRGGRAWPLTRRDLPATTSGG